MSYQNTNISEDMYNGSYDGGIIDENTPVFGTVLKHISANPLIVLVIIVVLVIIIIFMLFAYVFVKENYMAIGGSQARLQNNQNWQESFSNAKKFCKAPACDAASEDDLETLGYNSWAPYATTSRQLASTSPTKEGFEATDSRFFAGMMTGQ